MKNTLLAGLVFVVVCMAAFPCYPVEVKVFPPFVLSPLPHEALLFSPLTDFTAVYAPEESKVYMQMGVGGKLTALLLTFDNGLAMSTGGFAFVYSLFDLFSDSFNDITADYRLGGFADVLFGSFLGEVFVSHTSSHVGDDLLWLTSPPRINIGYEAVRAYVSYRAFDLATLSLGVDYKFGRRPLDLIFYDTAFLAAVRVELAPLSVPLFLDCEMELPGFFYTPSFGAKVGIHLDLFRQQDRNRLAPYPHHEAYIGYYNGYSQRGYFYSRREQLLTAGFAYRI